MEPLLTEATRLGIDSDELIALIKECSNEREVLPYDTGDLVREDQEYPDFAYPDFKVSHALGAASFCYPNWDAGLASSLLDDFGLRAGKAIKSLSRGQRSALGITIGLAARAEVTLFDEPYAGLDAVARQIFYDRLLADYADFPRTVLLSTHLIDEV